MAQAEGKRESNSAFLNSLPRDLLQRINSRNHVTGRFKETAQEEEADVELSLGLSSNGRFGVDPKRDSKLNRSSSIANLMTTEDRSAVRLAPFAPLAPLTRTCSLPTEPEEEWRKRKELQSLRRMEAKRKRLEKLKSVRTLRDQGHLEESGEENARAQSQGSVHIGGNAEFSSAFRKATRVSGAVGVAVKAHGNESRGERVNGLEGRPPQPSSQGSVGSQGTGSSAISELEAQPVQGMNKDTEARSPARAQNMHEQREQKPLLSTGETKEFGKIAGVVARNPPSSSEEVTATDEGANKMVSKVTLNMPCVSTIGDGPDGKRIEGFLYKYKKGEEVSIVCVCHGSFLSPAEFVKHAGGTDVAHPLRHIVVDPSSLL